MKRQLLALGTGAILLSVPASAGASTIGLDPNLVWDPSITQDCATTCTLAPDQFQNADFRVPPQIGTSHAVVTDVRLYGFGGEIRVRRLAPDARTAVSSGPWQALPAAAGVSAHALELPVQVGDGIGLDLRGGASVAYEEEQFLDGETVLRWEPALADGEARPPAAVLRGNLFLEVTIEPDVNQDGRGDETHPPPPPPPPPVDPPRRDPPPVDPPPVDPPRDEQRTDVPAGPAVPRAGPKVRIAGRAAASRKGVAAFSLTNPYGVAVKGTVKLKRGRRAVATARVTLAANGTRTVSIRLDRATQRTLARRGKAKLTVAATLRAPTGRARTTAKPVTVTSAAPVEPPTRRGTRTPPTRGGGDVGFDGTYRAPDGLVMVVQDGEVLSFSGSITTYCTETSKQKLVTFGMFGDDPDPTVAANGSFSYEATRGYGFVKLKYDGRIVGDRASGRLVVEDRSPLLGTGRFEFDYCFAGKDWTASK